MTIPKLFYFSHTSKNRLEKIHPDLAQVMHHALARSPIDFGITEGLRTLARQKKLLLAGKSRTLNSRHLTGHAVDIFAYINAKVDLNFSNYQCLAAVIQNVAMRLSIPIEWGGNWPSLRDGPHFQLPYLDYP